MQGRKSRNRVGTQIIVRSIVTPLLGGGVGYFLSTLLPQFVPTPLLFALFGALAFSGMGFLLRNPQIALLMNLSGVERQWIVFGRRRICSEAAKLLAYNYQKREQQLLELMSRGGLESCSYRTQIEIAELFYAQHSTRFWATSLDRWSTFLKSNEPYMRQMLDGCRDETTTRESLIQVGAIRLPDHARIFILPLDIFVKDVIDAPEEAHLLVKHHLTAWKVPVRLRLYPGKTVFPELNATFEKVKALSEEIIPDFMIVDDSFVYGRRYPESMELKAFEKPPEIKLGFIDDVQVLRAYGETFASLWSQALDLQDYCHAVVSPVSVLPSSAEFVALTRRTLDGYSVGEQNRVKGIFHSIARDLDDFYNKEERGIRYLSIPRDGSPLQIAAAFAEQIAESSGAILAIDQADLKCREDERFWQVWTENDDYHEFEEATRRAPTWEKRRIFVLRDWSSAMSLEAMIFIGKQLEGNIAVGLITQEEVQSLGEGQGGYTPTASSSKVDSEFIIVNLLKQSGRWEVGEETMGFEVSYLEYRPEAVQEESLLCGGKMRELVKWHELVWRRCGERLESVEDLRRLYEDFPVHSAVRFGSDSPDDDEAEVRPREGGS